MVKLNNKYDFKKILFIILCAGILILLITIVILNVNEKNNFIKSKSVVDIANDEDETVYRRISAKSICHEASIEFPITDSEHVNNLISDKIEEMFLNFTNDIKGLSLQCNNKHIISYEHNSFAENHVSIKLIEKIDIKNTKNERIFAWTFEKDTGNSLVLDNILNSLDGIDEVLSPDFDFFIDNENQNIEVVIENGNIFIISIDKYALHLKRDSFDGIFRDMFASNQPEETDCISEKCLALTYDDGPSIYTEQILDILRVKKARATFFVIGNRVHRYPELVSRSSREGHDVGSHSWSHSSIHGRGNNEIAQDINDTMYAIQTTTGKRVDFFSPPWGEVNDILNHELGRAGLQPVLWSIDTNDWQNRNAATTCNAVVSRAQAGGVVLMHDIYPSTVEATQCIIDSLSGEYTFVSLTDLYN